MGHIEKSKKKTVKTRRKNSTRVVAITSGKGGVGKTNIIANLAFALSLTGKKVMLLDADLGLGNIDILLGLSPKFNLKHVISGEKSIEEITIKGPAGIMILPAASGVQDITDLKPEGQLNLLERLDAFDNFPDFLLVDTGAGISSNVLYFNLAAQDVVVVASPEPTSITDAYAVMKVLFSKHGRRHFRLLVNMVATPEEGEEVFKNLSRVSAKYLDISIDYLGCILTDKNFPRAVKKQKMFMELYPHSLASKFFMDLANRICALPVNTYPQGNIQFFWRQFLEQAGGSG